MIKLLTLFLHNSSSGLACQLCLRFYCSLTRTLFQRHLFQQPECVFRMRKIGQVEVANMQLVNHGIEKQTLSGWHGPLEDYFLLHLHVMCSSECLHRLAPSSTDRTSPLRLEPDSQSLTRFGGTFSQRTLKDAEVEKKVKLG